MQVLDLDQSQSQHITLLLQPVRVGCIPDTKIDAGWTCWLSCMLHGNDSGSECHARKRTQMAKVGPHRMLFQQQLQLSIKTMFSNWSRTATIQFMPMLKPITAALNKNISWYPALDTHVLSYYQFDDKQITSHADIWWQSLQKLLLPQSGPSQRTLKFSGTFVAWIFLASYDSSETRSHIRM